MTELSRRTFMAISMASAVSQMIPASAAATEPLDDYGLLKQLVDSWKPGEPFNFEIHSFYDKWGRSIINYSFRLKGHRFMLAKDRAVPVNGDIKAWTIWHEEIEPGCPEAEKNICHDLRFDPYFAPPPKPEWEKRV